MSKTSFQATLTTTLSALLIGLAGAAQAEPNTVEISVAPLRAVNAYTANDLTGLYRMSDGRLMRLSYRTGTIEADLDGEPVTELRAVSGWQLRSADGRMEMRFDVDRGLGKTDVVVTLVKGQTVAQLSSAVAKR